VIVSHILCGCTECFAVTVYSCLYSCHILGSLLETGTLSRSEQVAVEVMG